MLLCCSQKGPRLYSLLVVECDAFSGDAVHHNSAAPRVLLAGGTFLILVRRQRSDSRGGGRQSIGPAAFQTSAFHLREAGRLTERAPPRLTGARGPACVAEKADGPAGSSKAIQNHRNARVVCECLSSG